VKIFDRAGRSVGTSPESEKSTLLFPTFAQWFTDGFLLTDPDNRLKTHTNHEIDFSALYGLKKSETDAVRLHSEEPGRRGRLKSQSLRGEEYAPFLYEDDGIAIKPEFAGKLRKPLHLPPDWPPEKRRTLFAFAGERANSTPQTAMLNTLFLREHNRLAGMIESRHPAWDDERVFQIVRNISIVLLLKIVIEEYINHISPYHFRFLANPGVSWKAHWNRPNWCAVEFNLLYRWHSFVPSEFAWPGATYSLANWVFDNRPLESAGLAAAFLATSRQKACALGLFNTPHDLLRTEIASVNQARSAHLGSYNDYRKAVGFPPAITFEDINDDPVVSEALKKLYVEPGNVEFYVGLFAESPRPNAAIMALIGRFVAIDAFSQAFTNPLLSQHVFNAKTFTQEGIDCIAATATLEDVLRRNVANPASLARGSVTTTQKR